MAHRTSVRKDMCSVLHLVLKKKWYDMIDALKKREEYRTSENVTKQIDRWYGHALVNDLNLAVVFYDGYGKDRRNMAFFADPPQLRTRCEHKEWGEPDGPHYVIPLFGGGIELV